MKTEINYIQEDMKMDKLPKEQQKRIGKLYDVPLKDLIERYGKSQTYGEDGKVLNDDYWDIPFVILDILKLPTISEVNKALKSIEDLAEEIDAKLRNHRHDTTKQFSAKPEF